MSTLSIVLIVIIVVLIAVLAALYFFGKKAQRRQAVQHVEWTHPAYRILDGSSDFYQYYIIHCDCVF